MVGKKNSMTLTSSDSSEELSSNPPLVTEEDLNVVVTWLKFLQMERYAKDFLDNGYDDMETVKQIGNEDLDAIGVSSASHRAFLLDAVRVVKEQGAVWVYLLQQDRVSGSTIHPYQISGDYDFGDGVSAGSSGIASANSSSCSPWVDNEQDFLGSGENSSSSCGSARQNVLNFTRTGGRRSRSSPVSSSNRSSPAVNQRCLVELTPEHLQNRSELNHLRFKLRQQQQNHPGRPVGKHQEEEEGGGDYDEDVIQLVSDMDAKSSIRNISPSRLSALIKGKLSKEGLILSASPFSSKANGDGYLLALASRYAFELNIEHRDILRVLEDLRWEEENVHTYANTGLLIDRSTSSMQLKFTLKPGRYASSSCLSDKDEDIYDYTPEEKTPLSRSSVPHPASAGWYRMAKRVMCRHGTKPESMSDSLPPAPILTRTRLRPGGPSTTLRHPPTTPASNLSDEEISMRTLGLRHPRAKPREPLFPVSSAFYGTLSSKPATPLVKQRTAGSASPRVQMYRTRVVYSDATEAPPNGRISVTTAGNNSHEAAV